MGFKNQFNNRLEKFSNSVSGFKNWLFAKPNEEQVLIIGIFSFVLALISIPLTICFLPENIEGVNGIWTLVTVFISSPVLFLIWRFRDQNISQQIENARKDTNLKEFQKLAEWVSGAHLVEDKVITKTQWKEEDGKNKKVIEETREFSTSSSDLAIQTYSKRDGAVGLQIAAIYNLLPFFRGEHGESFKKPALNLLLSAWQSMQQDSLNQLKQDNLSPKTVEKYIKEIQENANSPLGIAITRVLLNEGGKYLLLHPEIFPNLCLAGMNFHLSELEPSTMQNVLGNESIDYSGIQLQGVVFRNTKFRKLKYIGANLLGCELKTYNQWEEIDISDGNLSYSIFSSGPVLKLLFSKVIFSRSNLSYTKFSFTHFSGCNFIKTNLYQASLLKCGFDFDNEIRWHQVNLVKSKIYGSDINNIKFNGSILLKPDLKEWGNDINGKPKLYDIHKLIEQGLVVLCADEGEEKYKIQIQYKIPEQAQNTELDLVLDLDLVHLEDYYIISMGKYDETETKKLNPNWEITVEPIQD